MLPFSRVTIIGLGLIGSSLARAIREYMPTVRVTGHDADPDVRETARRIRKPEQLREKYLIWRRSKQLGIVSTRERTSMHLASSCGSV